MSVRIDYATPPPSRSQRHLRLAIAWVVIPIFFAVGGSWIGAQLGPKPIFTSEGVLLIGSDEVASPQEVLATQQAQTKALMDSALRSSIAAKTGVSVSEIAMNVQVTAVPDSRVIRIGYSSHSSQESFNVASAFFAGYPRQIPGTLPVEIGAYPMRPSIARRSILGYLMSAAGGLLAGFIGCVIVLWWQLKATGIQIAK